jgi:hypothetical protein
MNEQLVSIIHLVRFVAFPHVPLEQKVALFPLMLRFPMANHVVCETAHTLVQSNQFHAFALFLKRLRQQRQLCVWDPRKDVELMILVYMSEPEPDLSREILLAMVSFPILDDISYQQYKMGVNLLYSSACIQDTRLAIAFLNAI